MRKMLFASWFALLSVACGGGGGGSGPTAPPPVPQIAGGWAGAWSTGPLVVNPVMQVSQSGTAVTGTLAIFGFAFDIQGTVSSNLTLVWHATNGGCGSLSGDGSMSSLAPSQIVGSINLNTIGCPNPGSDTGPVVWSRTSASSTVATKASKRGTIEELMKALKR
jgi:hypothetical protein